MIQKRWFRIVMTIAIIGMALATAGYRLTQPEPETVAADQARANVAPVEARLISLQSTVVDKSMPVLDEQMIVFKNELFGYNIDYPVDWGLHELAANTVRFEAPDGQTSVTVEAVGPLANDDLATFVDLSLGQERVLSRQLLTVHGYPAERVISYPQDVGVQVTNFFINTQTSAFVITGIGEQRPIELIARSFNAPEALAWR